MNVNMPAKKITIPILIHVAGVYRHTEIHGKKERKKSDAWVRYIKKIIKKNKENTISELLDKSKPVFPKITRAITSFGTYLDGDCHFEQQVLNIIHRNQKRFNLLQHLGFNNNSQNVGKSPLSNIELEFIVMGGELNNCHLTEFKDVLAWCVKNGGKFSRLTIILPAEGIFESAVPADQVYNKYILHGSNYHDVFEKYIEACHRYPTQIQIDHSQKSIVVTVIKK
ncbi:MAG: hypothetical protein QS98_C0005G0019 [archaeon GW2011_AR3]|nr:MAG: hypothetical protein QS98_C0005G0019 [archaeon GW2011_AR3]